MPDPAVPRQSDIVDDEPAASAKLRRSVEANADVDVDRKLNRAARSAQRLADLSDGQRYGETLDLFAEDAERATLQAMNTDIRQGTFEGFELPEVFLAAVESTAKRRAARTNATPREPAEAAQQQGDLIADAFAPRPATPGKAAAIARQASVAWIAAPDVDLDGARATAFADTVDALRAVVSEQRATAAAHARRTKTLLTLTFCAMLTTLAAGIAQTVVLLHASRPATFAFLSDADSTASAARTGR